MKRRILAGIFAAMLLISLTACGEGEETTVTGMVASVEGTVVSIVQMDGRFGGNKTDKGERPSMPENFNGELPEGFSGELPEGFDGTMPNGENFPQRGENGETSQLPEGETMPAMPENGERPSFGGEEGKMPNFGNITENMETTQIDIGDAHISVEEDGVKASGSLSDIKTGVFVTITKNGKGKVTNVQVTAMSGFGGGFRGGNFGGSNIGDQQNA